MIKWTEAEIGRAVATQLLNRRCVLLVDNCNWTGHEADVLGIAMCRRLIDVEIKVSRADFRQDAKKTKWWHQPVWYGRGDRPEPVPRLWPPRVWKHYYVLPAEIWRDEMLADISPRSGVVTVSRSRTGFVSAACRRRCTANRDALPITDRDVMDIARLASLRLWDSYARLEARRDAAAAEAMA